MKNLPVEIQSFEKIRLLKKRNDIESFLQPVYARESVSNSYDLERLETVSLLFQTCYLTIQGNPRDDS
jgi:hypothetical protein